jgi:N-acetylmuramoyl-L-alanine amidase
VSFGADSPCVACCIEAANREPRRGGRKPDMLLLHYTGMRSAAGAVDWLTRPDSKVSCHYAVDEHGLITQMVPESLRAWHAGVSHWAGEDDINSCSIGIEIHNPGHHIDYWEFSPAQMAAVEALCADIVRRNGIRPGRVLGHSDVAPLRKDDPGEKFDWRRLAKAGAGLWVEPAPLNDDTGLDIGAACPDVVRLQERLRAIGYGIAASGTYDEVTRRVVLAFQRHWRQTRADGRADASTLETLARLEAALEPNMRPRPIRP